MKKYKCDNCGKNFAQNIGLKTHITAVHEKIKRFNCDQCGKTLSRGCDLKVHIQIVHEKVFEHICDDCGKNFTKAFNLKRHVQTIHEKKWKEIIQSSLNWHLWTIIIIFMSLSIALAKKFQFDLFIPVIHKN